uniref:Uncharacterized protein n=1 Tax=Rhizophora mucronata TaxID=61149 RepID=A0A2P2R1Y0_RHIMU
MLRYQFSFCFFRCLIYNCFFSQMCTLALSFFFFLIEFCVVNLVLLYLICYVL